jgi:TIR domain
VQIGFIVLVIAVGSLLGLGRVLRVRSWELAIMALVLGFSIYLGPHLLAELTDRRDRPIEMLPWITVVSLVVTFGWAFLRRDSALASPGARARPVPRAARVPPQEATPIAPARSVFVCYRRGDSADITGRICDRLTQRFGNDHVFKDVDSIPLGVDFRKYVGEHVGRCNALLAVIGRQWLKAEGSGARRLDEPLDLVRIEIGSALARGIPVIPVLVGGALMPGEQELPEDIRDLSYRNGIPVRPDPDFHKDIDRLIAGLEAHFHNPVATP